MQTAIVSSLLLAFAMPQSEATGKRAVLPKTAIAAIALDVAQTRIVVKLAEGRPDLVAFGRIVAPDVLAAVGNRPVHSFFRGLDRELTQLRERQLAAAAPGERPPVDLSLYYEVEAVDRPDCARLLQQLNALATVELAYPRELPTPPPGDIPPATPDFTANQGYRALPPNGLDGLTTQSTTGATGTGLRVLDIEWGWDLDHEDLSRVRAASLIGPPISQHASDDHGTAVLGEIVADADAYGVTGFAPDTQVFVATDYPASGYGVAQAILVGLPVLRRGDVILLEAQTLTPLGLGPTEWNQADFDAILIATGLGIITVEAAGNGNVNLDNPALLGMFQTSVRDSGAIIVGATNGSTLQRASFSTYGSRVNANGWGANVASSGYGDMFSVSGDRRQSYTATFSGTSSASPMVTAMVLALRGAALAQLDPGAQAALDGFAIRTLLGAHGTALVPGQGIGRRPDARALLNAAGVLRGLALRNEAQVGQACYLDLTPPFTPGPGDFFALLAGFDPVNAPLPPPFGPTDGRQLLAPATSSALVFSGFAGVPMSHPIVLPNDPSLRGVRAFAQGFTLRSSTGAITALNSVQILVRR